jgi:hypothetical protein
MGKGECKPRLNLLHLVQMSEESLPYQHGSCCVALEDVVTFFH